MADNGYARYNGLAATGGGIPIYPTFTSLPAGTTQGQTAVTADTETIYIWTGSAWVAISAPGDVLALGNLDAQAATGKGAALVSGVLSLQSATASLPGLVNNAAQSFSGDKTFTGAISASNLSGTNTGNVTIGTANGLSLSSQALSLGLSSTSTTGALSSTDWNTFNTKGVGTVTSVSVVSANGLAGTVATATTTPAITLSTSITGILQGNGTAISAATTTGSGSVVLATSPTLVTPALGTPSALVGTNITGTAAGLTAGNVTTNANLTGPITSSGNATSIASQTGTGTTFVMDTSPTLITPALGTPASATLTNATGLPLSTGVTGTLQAAQMPALTGDVTNSAGDLATTVAKIQGTTVSGTTGTTNVVFSTAPTLSNPVVGTQSAGDASTKAASTAYVDSAVSTAGSGYLLKANNLSDVSSAGTAFNNISPNTTLGDLTYGSGTNTSTRLAGNTTSTKKFLTQTGNDSISAVPGWNTIAGADLPNPSSSTLGGVQSLAVVSSKWINTISTSGVPAATQPAFTDISGSVAAGQMPALTGDITTSAGAVATTLASSISGAKTFSTSLTSPIFASSSSNIATSGALRLASLDQIHFRNNANNADVSLYHNASDQLGWNGSAFLDSTAVLLAAAFPALTGAITTTAGSLSTALATNAVINANLAQMAAHTYKGNNTGSTANALDLTQTQIATDINSYGASSLNVTKFTGNGTFTIPANINAATAFEIIVVGAGGGGGGAATGAGAAGGGAGAGATVYKMLTGLTAGNTLTVTVGTGGTAGSSAGGDGGAGNQSSVASGTQTITTISANGGGGGKGTTTTTAGDGGAGATTTSGGDYSDNGGDGSFGIFSSTSNFGGGTGGASSRGGGGKGSMAGGAGTGGHAHGSGGGGGSTNTGTQAGGAGQDGIVLIRWVA